MSSNSGRQARAPLRNHLCQADINQRIGAAIKLKLEIRQKMPKEKKSSRLKKLEADLFFRETLRQFFF